MSNKISKIECGIPCLCIDIKTGYQAQIEKGDILTYKNKKGQKYIFTIQGYEVELSKQQILNNFRKLN